MMEVRARLGRVRVSPRKARLVVDVVRGKRVSTKRWRCCGSCRKKTADSISRSC